MIKLELKERRSKVQRLKDQRLKDQRLEDQRWKELILKEQRLLIQIIHAMCPISVPLVTDGKVLQFKLKKIMFAKVASRPVRQTLRLTCIIFQSALKFVAKISMFGATNIRNCIFMNSLLRVCPDCSRMQKGDRRSILLEENRRTQEIFEKNQVN